jgi:type I restriction enzyme S subunit
MEVAKGYKQTEVGVIPEDWNPAEVQSFAEVKSGKRLPLGESLSKSETGHPYIRVTDMFMGGVDINDIRHVPKHVYPSISRYRIFSDDIFISVAGTLGIVGTIPKELDGANLTENANRFTKITINRDFLFHSLTSSPIQNTIESIRTVGAQPKLALTRIREFQIPLPPTKAEQEAIAEALSDADSLIESLQQLIAKKRQLKQGAMQELLRPKDDWVEKKYSEVAWYQEGPGVRKYQFTKDGVKLFNGTNLEAGKILLDKTDRHISEKEAYGAYSHFLAEVGDVVIACSGVTISKFEGKVSQIEVEHLPLCMNTSTMRFQVKEEWLLAEFLIQILRSNYFKDQIGGKATGSAQLNFGPSHIDAALINLPPLAEQTRIATILSDMDEEITALETKLNKARQLKQGMMHNLLTGKIRLV